MTHPANWSHLFEKIVHLGEEGAGCQLSALNAPIVAFHFEDFGFGLRQKLPDLGWAAMNEFSSEFDGKF